MRKKSRASRMFLLAICLSGMGFAVVGALTVLNASADEVAQPCRKCIQLKTSKMSRAAVVARLGRMLNADIYLTDPLEPGEIELQFDNVPADQALRRLLKGCSYALIYHAQFSRQAVHVMGEDHIRGRQAQHGPSAADEAQPEEPTPPEESVPSEPGVQRAHHLQGKIENLQKQVDSGYADRWYEQWSAIKDPKYLTDPRDQLDNYQKELVRLRGE